MSWNWNSHGLPFLPGYTFPDLTKSAFHRSQTLDYKNGYAFPRRPSVGIGQDPLLSEQLLQQDIDKMYFETSDLTYGTHDQSLDECFVPAHVALNKKVLRFFAFFEEKIQFSPEERYRIRPVIIYYYLEDDTMCIFEPLVENSGLPQGCRIKRQRLPKDQQKDHYQWKDLNLGMDLEVYGIKYRIAQCDVFTKEFLESEGIVLNNPEQMPEDPYSQSRIVPVPSFTTPSNHDRKHQYFTMDRKVLRFFATWDDTNSPFREVMPVTIQYFLVDDTIEIREVYKRNSGRDPFPVLMRRQKLPKKLKSKATESFPRCLMEVSAEEVEEYYSPKDFQLGKTVTLLGRLFVLNDCDGFTKEYYEQNHPDMEMQAIDAPYDSETPQKWKKEIPPYNGFGSAEDSLQNCFSLIPKPPKKNVLNLLENMNKVLRYSAMLDSQYPGDQGRHFILSYYLADDMISIFEKPSRNSGVIAGKFLEKTRVPKPGSTMDNPEFYSPADFAIGATVEVFRHRFVLYDADLYVLKYLESCSDRIPSETLNSVKHKLSGMLPNNPPTEQNGDGVVEPSS
ncbi:uncharacterized protein V6R79_016425 [Siganus canaliculatus]